jgi:ABC-type xylose transport system permease subunit
VIGASISAPGFFTYTNVTNTLITASTTAVTGLGIGRHACAIGGNRTAALVSGVNIDRVTIAVFARVGVTAAISGVMLSSQLMIVDATLGIADEF